MSPTAGPATAAVGSTRQGRRSLGGPADEQITRVVALVDAMAERGEADSLIAPLRPRLAQLRPRRLPSFGRALFAPLDPVIQPASAWRRGTIGIPRTALACLGADVRTMMSGDARAIEATLRAGRDDPDRATSRAGARLWPEAATILPRLEVSPVWARDTGLGADDHATIRSGCAAVLAVACDIDALLDAVAQGIEPDSGSLTRIVAAAAARGEFGAALIVAVLLHGLPAAAVLDAVQESVDPKTERILRVALDQAIDFQLTRLEAGLDPAADLKQAATEAGRAACLLDALDRPAQASTPARRARVALLRRQLDDSCRLRMASELNLRVLQPSGDLTCDAPDEDFLRVEHGARLIRQYERSARRLGGGPHYDGLLEVAGAHATRLGLPLIDRVRLVELLLGAEAALNLLGKG